MKKKNKWVVVIAITALTLLHTIVNRQENAAASSTGTPAKIKSATGIVDLLSPVSIAISIRY